MIKTDEFPLSFSCLTVFTMLPKLYEKSQMLR